MADDKHNEELMRWCVDQVIKSHQGAGLQMKTIQAEAQILYDFIDNAGPTPAKADA